MRADYKLREVETAAVGRSDYAGHIGEEDLGRILSEGYRVLFIRQSGYLGENEFWVVLRAPSR